MPLFNQQEVKAGNAIKLGSEREAELPFILCTPYKMQLTRRGRKGERRGTDTKKRQSIGTKIKATRASESVSLYKSTRGSSSQWLKSLRPRLEN